MADDNYIPVSCGLYDRIEAASVKSTVCEIRYKGGTGEMLETKQQIAWLKSESGAEFALLRDGTKIRLDKIISINGESFSGTNV